MILRKLTIFLISSFSLAFIFYNCISFQKKPYFILITLDTQRADFISSYSKENSITPNIDWIAKNGILFENCYSLIPITLPSHAIIFYSQPPYKLNVYNNGEIFNSKEKISLTEIFKKKGYITGAFISLGVLTSKYGLNNGFDYYYDKFPKTRWYLTAEEINFQVFQWLEKNKNKKFFLWIHYSDPHDPYAPPYLPPNFRIYLNKKIISELNLKNSTFYYLKLNLRKGENILKFEVLKDFSQKENDYLARLNTLEFNNSLNLKLNFEKGWLIEKRKKIIYFLKKEAIMKLINNSKNEREIEIKIEGKLILPPNEQRELYKKEVEYMDSELGKLINKLKELKILNNTYIIVIGDHGEGLGEYKTAWGGFHFGHIHYLYNVYLKVPFIIYNPYSFTKGIKISKLVTLLDIAPTILEGLMKWKKPKQMEGRNLLDQNELKRISEIYTETYTPESYYDRFSIISYPWHLIFTPKKKQYELFNLINDPNERNNIFLHSKNKKEIIELKNKLNEYTKNALKKRIFKNKDEDTLKMLKSLGYLR